MSLGPLMRPFSPTRVRLTGGFWFDRQRAMAERGLEAQYVQIAEKTGRLENFKRAAKRESGGHQGIYFDDSDVYKWMEACAYALRRFPRPSLAAKFKEVSDAVLAAQMPDGYLDTFFQLNHPDLRWKSISAMHEMYCAGHLIEAAVAHFECTGERSLLEAATRLAGHIGGIFGPGKRLGYCGHEEIELALIRLSGATGDRRYRELAAWMLAKRGTRPSPFEAEARDPDAIKLSPNMAGMLQKDGKYSGEYCQDHAPISEHTEVVGHAVRSMYLYSGAAEVLDEHPEFLPAMERVWKNLTERRMYVTGGIGPSAHNEGFTADFDLPNFTAYAETCASVGLIFWASRMLARTGRTEFADVMERALFNGALSGVSLDAESYFYTNPLESRGEHERVPWFGCACCPPNIARLISGVERYLISESVFEPGVWIHIPASLEVHFEANEVPVKLTIESNYPWDGKFKVRAEPERPTEFSLHVRNPGWLKKDRPYEAIKRTWSKGDVVEFDWSCEPHWVRSDLRVLDNIGRVALVREPVVYCLEQADFQKVPQSFSADTDAIAKRDFESKLLGGVETLTVSGREIQTNGKGELNSQSKQRANAANARFIPYYAWNNRGPCAMQVWIRELIR